MGKFTKYTLHSIGTQFIVLILSFLISVIPSRILGPEGRGQLTLILLIPMLTVTFGKMGIGHAVNYYASKISSTKLIAHSFILSLFQSILLLLVSVPIVFGLKNVFFSSLDLRFLILAILFIPFYLFNNHILSLLQGLYKIEFRNIISIIQPLMNLILLITFTLFFNLGLTGAVIASFSSFIIVNIICILYLFDDLDVRLIEPDFVFIRQLFGFGIKSHFGNVLKDLSYRGDILVLSYFLPPASVGYYIVAVNIAEIIWKIPDAVGSVLLPRIAQMDNNSAKLLTPVVCRMIVIPVVLACLLLLLFSKNIISLTFGDEFLPSSSALLILLPGIMGFSVWKIIANDLIAQGYPTRYSITSAISLATMIALDIFLIPKYGINGAAMASTISYLTASISIIYIYIRITNNSFKSILFPSVSDIILYKKVFN